LLGSDCQRWSGGSGWSYQTTGWPYLYGLTHQPVVDKLTDVSDRYGMMNLSVEKFDW